ncbi:MAG: O-methyltransferase [Bacteroidota bacterium]|nr:O-methyltransferase [Bacteroidota bacterium]
MPDIIYQNQLDYLNKFANNNDPLLDEMEKYAMDNLVPILEKQAAFFLEQLIIIKNPSRVLEIGMAIGYSSIRIAKILPDSSEFFTIDKSKPNIAKAKSYFERAGVSKKINILEGDAIDILPSYNKFDFIFLDADKEDYLKLFEISANLLNDNGIIFVDNLLWHGYTAAEVIPDKVVNSTNYIREFNEMFMGLKQFKTTILPIGDGIGIAVKL